MRQFARRIPIEGGCWVAALVFLYFCDPYSHHFTLCPLESMGWKWCPGCGLGRSISLFMRGEIRESVAMHVLGIPAFFTLIHRIYTLTKLTYDHWKIPYYHEQS